MSRAQDPVSGLDRQLLMQVRNGWAEPSSGGEISRLEKWGLVAIDGKRLVLTPQGQARCEEGPHST